MNQETIKTVGTPEPSATPRSAVEIAESVLGNIAWKSQFEGYCDCPGKIKHTTRDAEKDCHVYLDKVPTVFCFHRRCRVAIKLANERLRGDIMDAEIEKLLIERRGKKDAAPKLGLVATVDGVGKGTQSGSCLQKGDTFVMSGAIQETPSNRLTWDHRSAVRDNQARQRRDN